MGHTLLCELGLILLFTLLCSGHAEDAVLTTDPNWSTVFIGESVTFKCDVEEGEEGDWEYKINKNGQTYVHYNSYKTYTLYIQSKDNSGKYQCAAHHKSSGNTEDSNTIHLTVLDKPTATLTADKTTTSVGGSVKLTCSLEGSVGWPSQWFRRVPGSTEDPVEKHEGENKVVSVLQGGIYRCRGLRGEPPFYSDISKDVTICVQSWKRRPRVSL
ncbi:uncharacterized protein LOC114436671 [Parambassis ranga]|uniref:Uncharacterized protein LOC114436671 n=1 Tax=Parambassis ranga TaxID=210632 RepID=A0A6P7IIV3_9TELE|nr:uncharacterized protein LOC114436671 [Parambassis ranga]